MIQFENDEHGGLIEFEPKLRSRGDAKRFNATCNECGKQYALISRVNVAKMRCECHAKGEGLLEFQGESKTLEAWITQYPEISASSVGTRLSNRRRGVRNCTDAEILWGYKYKLDRAITLAEKSDGVKWKAVLAQELSKRLDKLPLLDAVIASIYIACQVDDFSLPEEDNAVSFFTPEGLRFKVRGQTLLEIFGIVDGDILQLQRILLEYGVTEDVIKNLII